MFDIHKTFCKKKTLDDKINVVNIFNILIFKKILPLANVKFFI